MKTKTMVLLGAGGALAALLAVLASTHRAARKTSLALAGGGGGGGRKSDAQESRAKLHDFQRSYGDLGGKAVLSYYGVPEQYQKPLIAAGDKIGLESAAGIGGDASKAAAAVKKAWQGLV